MAERRIDDGEKLGKPRKQPNGWLRVDARLTRTGVFRYLNADGTVRREYRPPEEVFNADSLASFEGVPVTDEHPPTWLDAENTKEYQRGHLGDSVTRDGQLVAAKLMVTDAALVAKLEKGEAQQLSCGYSCELVHRPGTTPTGERYDFVQTNIRGNHVAVVKMGRAGPEARVRMDGALVGSPEVSEATHVKIRIDGIEYDAGSEAHLQAAARWESIQAATLAKAQKALDEATARADSLQAKLDSATQQAAEMKAKAAELPKLALAEARKRLELEAKLKPYLSSKLDVADLTVEELQRKALARLLPEAKLDGKTAVYVEARLDAELEAREDTQPPRKSKPAPAVDDEEREDEEDLTGDDEDPVVKLRKADSQAWQETLKRAQKDA